MPICKIEITKPVFGGYCLGFHNGKAIFVWGTLPGEIVEIEIYRDYSSHAFAKILHIVQQSPNRIVPACPNFGNCGGCDYLHMEYDEELRIKKEIIIDSLIRIGKIAHQDIPHIETIFASRFGYRTHADVKFSPDGKVGFYRKESTEVIPFPQKGCLLLAQPLIEGLQTLKPIGQKSCKIAVGSDEVFHSSIEDMSIITEKENDLVFQRSINCFFQANRFLRSRMAQIVCDYAQMDYSKRLIDAGCGVGFFALHCARLSKSGLGVDISKESIRWAQHNAHINNITNVEFYTENFSSLLINNDNWDVVVIDPPRAGLSKKARRIINLISPKQIIYVSCNPTTFARDAKDFIYGHYVLAQLTFIDMFPGTKHIEMIGLFKKLRN